MRETQKFPLVEKLKTCYIVQLPEPKRWEHRLIISELKSICFNDPAMCDGRTFVLPYDTDRLDLERVWDNIRNFYGQFVYVQKVV